MLRSFRKTPISNCNGSACTIQHLCHEQFFRIKLIRGKLLRKEIQSSFHETPSMSLSDFLTQLHNVLGHTNFWKKQQKNLQFFLSRCKQGYLIKRKTKGFKNIFIGRLLNSIKNEIFWAFLINNIDFHTTAYN